MSARNTIRWFVKAQFDAPELRSPQPCKRGVHCDFRRWNADSQQMEPAVCHFVHPGEEGTGRRLFPARQLKEVGAESSFREQPACVRLTGAADTFYERCGRKIPWGVWCAQKGIPYTPLEPGAEWEPVTVLRIGGPQGPPRTPQGRKDAAPRPAPMAPKRSSGLTSSGGILNIEEWLTTATEEELAEYERNCEEQEKDAKRIRSLLVYRDPLVAANSNVPAETSAFDYQHNVDNCACGTCYKARIDSGTEAAYLKRYEERAAVILSGLPRNLVAERQDSYQLGVN